ncbi:MAG: hypothetical protein ACRDC6_04410 [Shewanella sp.]
MVSDPSGFAITSLVSLVNEFTATGLPAVFAFAKAVTSSIVPTTDESVGTGAAEQGGTEAHNSADAETTTVNNLQIFAHEYRCMAYPMSNE